MASLEECISVYANLLVRLKELDELLKELNELRERTEKAKKLYAAMPAPLKQKPVSFH
jgi:hypothetical protein